MKAPYPNPFNPRATVSFTLAQSGSASIRIYDTRGRLVRTLVDENMPAGEHTRVWEGRNDRGRSVASGLYLVEFRTRGVREVRRVTLLK
jgi:flagellar hook assembly protein FlgD